MPQLSFIAAATTLQNQLSLQQPFPHGLVLPPPQQLSLLQSQPPCRAHTIIFCCHTITSSTAVPILLPQGHQLHRFKHCVLGVCILRLPQVSCVFLGCAMGSDWFHFLHSTPSTHTFSTPALLILSINQLIGSVSLDAAEGKQNCAEIHVVDVQLHSFLQALVSCREHTGNILRLSEGDMSRQDGSWCGESRFDWCCG